MASFANEYKYTLGYSVSQGTETASRLIAGINTSGASSPSENGPTMNTVANVLSTTLAAFTAGTMGATGRWIQERVVTF